MFYTARGLFIKPSKTHQNPEVHGDSVAFPGIPAREVSLPKATIGYRNNELLVGLLSSAIWPFPSFICIQHTSIYRGLCWVVNSCTPRFQGRQGITQKSGRTRSKSAKKSGLKLVTSATSSTLRCASCASCSPVSEASVAWA